MQIGIAGAGAIGCYLGVRMSASGARVRMLARPRVVEIADRLEAIDLRGRRARPGEGFAVSEDPEVLAGCDAALVTTKSADTESMGRRLAEVLGPDALVLTLQNGLSNARRLRAAVRGPVERGIVSYNVFWDGPHRLRQATAGKLVVGDHPAARGARGALESAGERVEVSDRIERVMAGKLLMNLNNGICAATGLSIAASIRDRDARRCLGACIGEGHRVLVAAGLHPVSPLGLPLALVPPLMGLPDGIVLRVAKRLVDADERATSSTLQDLERGKRTEIDELNGAIVRLGVERGIATPANGAVVDVVHDHEAAIERGEEPTFPSARALLARIRSG